VPRALLTGSSGLIGSEIVAHFAGHGWLVHGADHNQRADFCGPNGDTWSRIGFRDHICSIGNLPAMKPPCPMGSMTMPLDDIFQTIHDNWTVRLA
jgi:nucleoside-diphosphate-sugar epimerase